MSLAEMLKKSFIRIMNDKSFRIILITRLFWFFSLPLFGASAIYALIMHQNLLESFLFYFSFMTCVPYLIMRTDQLREESVDNFSEEFSKMSDSEFLAFDKKLENPLLGKNRHLLKEAYSIEYGRRLEKRKNTYN